MTEANEGTEEVVPVAFVTTPLTRPLLTRFLWLLDPDGTQFVDTLLQNKVSLEDMSSISSETLESFGLPEHIVQKMVRWQSIPRLLDSEHMIKFTRRYFMTLQYTVGMTSYQQDDYLAAATIRYKKWLYLKKIHRKEKLYMPCDIYFIYVVHTLHPISYARTCREIFGTIVRPEEILSLKKYKLHTQQLWQQTFDEDLDSSYHYFLCHSPDRNKMIEVPIDLAQGGKNQGTFFEKMQNVILTDEYLKTAIKEYQEFLALRKKLNMAEKWNEIIVPTLRQDLVWHTHMMHPMSYALECLTLGGEYMDHNDFLDDNTLKVQFSKTKANFQLK